MKKSKLYPLLVWHCVFLNQTFAYIAYVELELLSFRVLDRDTIAEGSKCDDDHVNGAWNLCDFVFYVRNCSRVESTYECTTRIDRFYAPENTDFVTFDYPRPATGVTIEGAPKEMVFNITVYDQDDGRSADDFVGNYLLRVTPDLIFRQDSRLVGMTEQVITIPRHSELKLRWRAYCGDTDCRIGAIGPYPAGVGAPLVPQETANFANAAANYRGSQALPPQSQWGQLTGAAQQINPALFQPTQFQPPVQNFISGGQQPLPPQITDPNFGGFVQQHFSPIQVRSVPRTETEPVREAAERSEIRTALPPESSTTEKEQPRFVPFHWRSGDNKELASEVSRPVGPPATFETPLKAKIEEPERTTARERSAAPGSVPAEEIRWPSSSTKRGGGAEPLETKGEKSGEGSEKKSSWASLQPERIDALYKKQEVKR